MPQQSINALKPITEKLFKQGPERNPPHFTCLFTRTLRCIPWHRLQICAIGHALNANKKSAQNCVALIPSESLRGWNRLQSHENGPNPPSNFRPIVRLLTENLRKLVLILIRFRFDPLIFKQPLNTHDEFLKSQHIVSNLIRWHKKSRSILAMNTASYFSNFKGKVNQQQPWADLAYQHPDTIHNKT